MRFFPVDMCLRLLRRRSWAPWVARSAVAARAGGSTGHLLAHAARTAFMSGNEVSLAVGGALSLAGAILVLAGLPSRKVR